MRCHDGEQWIRSIRDALALVDVCVHLTELRKRTWWELYAVHWWAYKTHLRASDNVVRVPPRPEWLPNRRVRHAYSDVMP